MFRRYKLLKLSGVVIKRNAGDCSTGSGKKGLLLGAYDGCHPGEYKYTQIATKVDDELGGKLKALLKGSGLRKKSAQVYSNIHADFYAIGVAGLGQEGVGVNDLEHLDECKENIRIAAGVGAMALQEQGLQSLFIEGFTNTEAAAEGALLGIWRYQDLKNRDRQEPTPKLDLFEDPDREGWQRGIAKADAQNLARRLEDTPGNLMNPSIFAQNAIDALCPCGVQVEVRDRDWIESKKMSAFLSMSKGSCEPPLFLEVGYCAAKPSDMPVVLTGKGVTFDTGGICLKPSEGMSEFRGDVSGAAVCVAVLKAIATMALPINVTALIPLCENMIGGMAMKPGDVVLGGNGKTIRIEDTDNDGRLILADALHFSHNFKPCMIINIASLTAGMKYALGTSSCGLFTKSNQIWGEFDRAGLETGDRMWRFPIWKYFTSKVTDYVGVDVNNVGKGVGGEPCLGAAFLQEFIPQTEFVHIDISGAGLISNGIGHPYLRKGSMSGRPTRTVAQFLYQMSCPHSKGDEC